MIIATAQPWVTPDVVANGEQVRSLMWEANAKGARLVHFPEGALSGYPTFAGQDWERLKHEMGATCALARDLHLWVVVGSNHPMEAARPRNGLHVISDGGELIGRYDKRICSFNEAAKHYDAGTDALVFALDGFRFGCALCIEVNFPELFRQYEELRVDCVLFSAHADDPIFAVQAQAHAATNCYWVSVSTPANFADRLPAGLIGPDGHWIARCTAEGPASVVSGPLDRNAPQFDVALNRARPWRRLTRETAGSASWSQPRVRS